MLSSGSIHIRGETGGAAPRHSREASNTDAAVKVCLWLCSLPQRGRQRLFQDFGVRLPVLQWPPVTLSSSESPCELSLHHLHATCCSSHQGLA